MIEKDTIAALATPSGRGGIAIVRISGDQAEEILGALFRPQREFESHRMYYGHIEHGGEIIDECMAVVMRAPNSYTREDVVEIHLHGGEWAAEGALAAAYALGARPAQPGEFTRRAFLNGRIDLSQAEAVMQMISAEGERAARAAVRQLSGGASAFIREAQAKLLSLLAGVEAAIDYPDEIEESEAVGQLREGALTLAQTLENACDERGARLMEKGLEVVLCGRTNVGKSSLLNRLLAEERAIVTDIPGTTRDIVRGSVLLGGLRVNLSDTAGLRESDERVERIGIDRARQAMENADVAVLVLDGAGERTIEDDELIARVQGMPHLYVVNKGDLPMRFDTSGLDCLTVSAGTGEGVEALSRAIAAFGAGAGQTELTQARHMRLAREAAGALREAAAGCARGDAIDLIAVELHEALNALSRVTGDQVDEKLLDDVFSRFCVGK